MIKFNAHSTTGAAMDRIFKVTQDCRLQEIRFNFATVTTAGDAGATAAGDFVVSINSENTAGATYCEMDIIRQAILGVRDILWQPDRPVYLWKGDKIHCVLAAETSAKQWNLDILVE